MKHKCLTHEIVNSRCFLSSVCHVQRAKDVARDASEASDDDDPDSLNIFLQGKHPKSKRKLKITKVSES